MKKNTLISVVLGVLVSSTVSAAAFDETLQIRSRTLSDEEFLQGKANGGTPVTVQGHLEGPDIQDKQPVVVLLHGTDGPRSGAVWNWNRFLSGIGIANFTLDSYTGRGLETASANQSKFGQFTQVYDAYRAVEVLAAHPKIDGERIVVMGFSRGATAALYSAMQRFQKSFGPKQGKIAAHLPFYPACNFELVDELNVTSAPIREFHGVDDDWTPAAPCRAYIDRLAQSGHDAEMTVYPNALHAFDNLKGPARASDSTWQTSRSCLRKEKDGQLLNAATGKPFSYADACVEYGPSSQYNDAASTAAQAAVKSFLEDLFK